MDFSDLIGAAIFILWILSQFARGKNKTKPRPGQAQPAPPPVPPERLARGLLDKLSQLDGSLTTAVAEAEPILAVQAEFVRTRSFGPELERIRLSLQPAVEDRGDAPGTPTRLTLGERQQLVREIANAQGLVQFVQQILQATKTHAALRRRPEVDTARLVADRVVEDFYRDFKAFADERVIELSAAPPVALVWDVAPNDPMRSSPLGLSTLFVPRGVLRQPLHWSALGEEIGRYLAGATPGMFDEIYERLRLGEGEGGRDPAALGRILFASWMGRIVTDAAASLLFGPAYLRALARLKASPNQPAQVLGIRLAQDGTVAAEPPAHMRVELTARWLTRMQWEVEAEEIRREWASAHHEPQALLIVGSGNALPLEPLLPVMWQLMDDLHTLELDCLGATRLRDTPGLKDWNRLETSSREAATALPAGEPTRGSPRALVAAAMQAAVESPDSGETIHEAVFNSVTMGLGSRPRGRGVEPSRPVARPKPSLGFSAQEIAEALILNEILLERR